MKIGLRALLLGCVMTALTALTVPALAEGDVAFAYQGRVKVQGQPFTGTGHFKFSIIDTSGTATLWSHDGSAQNGGEPSGQIQLPVQDGIFNVMVGDTSVTTNPINATIFNSPTPVKLRVWFNDGTRGFQQLNPDHKLVNLTLNVLETGQQDFTIYVNGATGSDRNNGLTPSTAKKTIQAAVDTLPERVRCNVTIDVANGVYRETVRVFGMSVLPGKTVRIVGDETWVPGAGDPAVRITGTDNDAAPTRVRDYGIIAVQCSGVVLRGLHINHFGEAGVQIDNGVYVVENCKLASNRNGVVAADCSTTCSKLSISASSENGIYLTRQTAAIVRECSSNSNTGNGLALNGGVTANMQGVSSYSSNGNTGIVVQHHSAIVFSAGGRGAIAYSGTVSGNGVSGLGLSYQSYSENHTVNNWGSGNGLNGGKNIETIYGGMTTY